MVKGETYNKQLFESEAFRHFINVFTNKQSGVTQGCEVTKDTQNITVEEGYFFIQGGLLRETTGTANSIPNEAGYYKLVYEIDLSKTNAKDVFNQGSYKFIKALGDYPSLTQEDLDNGGTIYQLPFAQFRITEEGLQDFEDIRPIINYGIYEKKGTVLYEDEEETNGDITLNDSIENYDYADIFYVTTTGRAGSVRVKDLSQAISLPIIVTSSSTFVVVCKVIEFEGAIVKKVSEHQYMRNTANQDSFITTNIIAITKIVGYKD